MEYGVERGSRSVSDDAASASGRGCPKELMDRNEAGFLHMRGMREMPSGYGSPSVEACEQCKGNGTAGLHACN